MPSQLQNPNPEDDLADLRDLLAMSLAKGAGDAVLSALRAQIRDLELTIESGGGAVVGGAVSVQRDFVGRDQTYIQTQIVQVSDRYWRHFPGGPPSPDLRAATEQYLLWLYDRHRYLALKGMGVHDRVPLQLSLLDLYVPLQARRDLPEGETWRRVLQLAGRDQEGAESELMGRLGEPQPALELLKQNDGLVVLGDPGSGKTTFLKVLALELATGASELGERQPVLVPLAGYANLLAERDVPLDDYVADHFHDIGADLPVAELLRDALQRGAALVLLDGLDEVTGARLRHTVVERVVDFYTRHRRAGNKFVLTSRIVGYREVRPVAPGLAECTLVDFEDDEIGDFVERWTAALERQAQGQESDLARTQALVDAAQERRELLDAAQRNPGVRRLAANPLLLIILALMKRQGVSLPERRVELYDQYVSTLLSTWNRARSLSGRATIDATLGEVDPKQTLRILEPLALWMHEVNPGKGLVGRAALHAKLEELYRARGASDPEASADRFRVAVREHAGLLLERGAGQYGFIHLTFEEYLAAAGIASLGQQGIEPILAQFAAHVGDPAWREVLLLAVGYLGVVQSREQAAGALLEALVDQQPGPTGEAVVLAGEATVDIAPLGVAPASVARVSDALVETMQQSATPPTLRRRAGLALGRLGWLPDDLDAFVEVQPGNFLYGENKQRRTLEHLYWIARYPVCNAQYARFLEDGGYNRREFWSELGWAWRTGEYDTKATGVKKGWVDRRPTAERELPAFWHDPERANPLSQVVGVTWFEADAYARWLDAGLETIPMADGAGATRPAGYVVRLPEETEWERAARGSDGRAYPWGDDFDFASANVAETLGGGMGGSAVNAFPQGVNPVGAWDMAGNVWEWTRTPYDERNFVLRGGSWWDDPSGVRCAVRNGLIPGGFYGSGFRVVVSLAVF